MDRRFINFVPLVFHDNGKLGAAPTNLKGSVNRVSKSTMGSIITEFADMFSGEHVIPSSSRSDLNVRIAELPGLST